MALKNPIVSALSGERVLHANALATVTENCIVVGAPDGHAHTVLPLVRVTQMKVVKTSHPAFLVIATGLCLIAAAALISADGGGAAIPAALLAVAAFGGYLATRRAAVAFTIDSETTETVSGSLRQAAALIAALHSAQAGIVRESETENAPE